MKTNAEIRKENIKEFEDKLVAIEFIHSKVLPIIEKFDGKKVTKRISTAVKKELEGHENISYIGDISYNTDYFNRIYGTKLYFSFIADGRIFTYEMEMVTDKRLPNGMTEENQYNHAETVEKNNSQRVYYEDKLERLEGFTISNAKATAKQVDDLMNQIKAISEGLSGEQRTLVQREMKGSSRYLPFQ